MNDCERLRPVLVRTVEGDAAPDEALELGKHLSDCTVCRILLARQRRIADMVSELGEPIEVQESFLREIMASLPDGPPPPMPDGIRHGRKTWRVVKLASFLLLAALFLPGPWTLPGLPDGLGDLPRVVPITQRDALPDTPAPVEGASRLVLAAVAGAGARLGIDLPAAPVWSGLVAALAAAAAGVLLCVSAGLGVAARAVARNFS